MIFRKVTIHNYFINLLVFILDILLYIYLYSATILYQIITFILVCFVYILHILLYPFKIINNDKVSQIIQVYVGLPIFLFVFSMLLLIASFSLFLHEIFIASHSLPATAVHRQRQFENLT